MCKETETIVPISAGGGTAEEIIGKIMYQNTQYGIKTFAIAMPSKGCRSTGYPSIEMYEQMANVFLDVKNKLKDKDIQLGWWNMVTLKSGRSSQFSPIIKRDGSEHPFANCPLDENFTKRFSEDVALFAKIAKPAFILFEDDYSITAASGVSGCMCEKHLNEFARIMGRRYEREELLDIFNKRDEKSIEILKKYRELTKKTMVELSEIVRKEVDKDSPEIPIGLCQAGGVDRDGDTTEEVSCALAGEKHIPFSRLYGSFYCGGEHKSIPCEMYHAIYSKQHINRKFKFIYEADCYPHTRFFSSGKEMKTFMSIAYSQGFAGSLLHTQQAIDNPNDTPNEERTFGELFCAEKERFDALINITHNCKSLGVEIPYDPFYNTIDVGQSPMPFWVRTISLFGMPYVTTPAPIAFIDERQAKYSTHEEIIRYLSGGLFMDGAAAKVLCARGYEKYIGVRVGEDVAKGNVASDLAAYERLVPTLECYSKGKKMPIAHCFCVGRNGHLLELTKIDERCETVSEAYTSDEKLLTIAMTRFHNELGGKVVVMGMTVENNISQSLFNYRRKRAFEELLVWCADEVPFVRNEPNMYFICNEAKGTTDFRYQFTLINLGYDDINELAIHLPKKMKFHELYQLNEKGEWIRLDFTNNEDGFIVNCSFKHCEPVYLLLK